MSHPMLHAFALDSGASPSVIVADDEAPILRLVGRWLQDAGIRVETAPDAAALRALLPGLPQAALLDLRFGEASGVDLIGEIHSHSPDTEVVVMTGYATVDSAVSCMRAGAFDYLEKPLRDRHRVVETVCRALERRSLRVRNRELEVELDRRSTLDRVVAHSPAMRRVVQMIRDLAPNESNVLIQAESGTGKELVSRAIHETSRRREAPFVPVDCGALPEGIVEGELFGYERGAFTGATRSSPGLFRSGHGGTLFLDEIGELPAPLQAKLLRALQEREVRPLGSAHAVPTDVRIVAATNRDLEAEIRAGRFRRDLFYRLRVVSIQLPPLRERPEDIPVLAAHFLERCARGTHVRGIEPAALEALLAHAWEGNVRELENTIEAAVALARGSRLSIEDLGLRPARRPAATRPPSHEIPLSLRAYEGRCLAEALRRSAGDVSAAARLLGIGRSTLYRKLRAHGLS